MDKIQAFKEKLYQLKHYKEVSEEDYNKYVHEYESKYDMKLCNHSVNFCTSPKHGKYDFFLNPVDSDATVCQVAFMTEGGWYNDPNPDRYYVVDNIEEVKKFVEDIEESFDSSNEVIEKIC